MFNNCTSTYNINYLGVILMNEQTRSKKKWNILLTAVFGISIVLSGCANEKEVSKPTNETKQVQKNEDLSGVKTYLLKKSTELRDSTAELKKASDQYYNLATAANFDYAALWNKDNETVRKVLLDAKKHYLVANPSYELMEGIVAGVPSLAQFDIDLDAGIAASEGTEDVVSFDVKLPNGKVLQKPGNYFFLAEVTLWGTKPEWNVSNVKADLDGNGKVDFGEGLPDANILKGISDGFAVMSADLLKSSEVWQPTNSDAFTSLVVMIPTMEEYFQSWKESRFISGDTVKSQAFVASSRLNDIIDILSGLEVVYSHVEPMVAKSDATQAEQTKNDLSKLKAYVEDIYSKEQAGTKFKPEDADTMGTEAQNRATAIAGQITQAAAKLQIKIEE